MKFRTKRKQSGFTLVETCITFTVLALILSAVGAVTLAGRDVYQEGMSVATLEARARRALERMATELTAGVKTTLTPNPNTNLGSSSLQFQSGTGFSAGTQSLSGLTSIQLESDPNDPDDGIDNDSDGLIDEGQVVLVRNLGQADEIRTVLCKGVRKYLEGETANVADDNANGVVDERGLSFHADADGTLTLRLTLQARDPKNRLMVRTVETSVHMRN